LHRLPDAVVAAGAANLGAATAVVALARVQVGEVDQLKVVGVCNTKAWLLKQSFNCYRVV
jgi:hypothetical protein